MQGLVVEIMGAVVGNGVGEALCYPLEMGTGRKERPEQAICCKAGDETRELHLGRGGRSKI